MQLLERVRAWLEPPGVDEQTEEVFRSIWRTVRAKSARHPFHSEVLSDLDRLIDRAASLPPDTLVEVDDVPITLGAVPKWHPRVVVRLTPEWMKGFVVAEVARVTEVANSADYLTKHTPPSEFTDDKHHLVVQHRASGLRALFRWRDGAQIGGIHAKSYEIPSIDPSRVGHDEGLQAVHQWEGLGITSRLYQYGATLRPALRWGATHLTNQSAALRRRLHRHDPWRFAASSNLEQHPTTACRWCIDNGWADLERSAFNSHPPTNGWTDLPRRP